MGRSKLSDKDRMHRLVLYVPWDVAEKAESIPRKLRGEWATRALRAERMPEAEEDDVEEPARKRGGR